MTYILLLMVWAGNSGAVTSATYESKEACVVAGEAARQDFKIGLTVIRYSCSPRGTL
jgi:hypothetical protein